MLQCYRVQASVTVLQSPGQGTDGGMCDGTYVRELVHVNVTRDELWATSRMPPVLSHNLWGRVYVPVERVSSLTNSAASLVDGAGLMIWAVLA